MLRAVATLVNRACRVYWRIAKPRTFGVRALVFDAGGRVLLVRHTYDKYWYLPGGGMKRGEPAEAALRRELREELGIAALAIERLHGTFTSTFEGKRDTIAVFVARAETIGARQRLEIAAAGWFALDALPREISPATARRIAEHRGQRAISAGW